MREVEYKDQHREQFFFCFVFFCSFKRRKTIAHKTVNNVSSLSKEKDAKQTRLEYQGSYSLKNERGLSSNINNSNYNNNNNNNNSNNKNYNNININK